MTPQEGSTSAISDAIPTLVSARLTLDAVVPGDADAILGYCEDPELQRWIPVPVPYSRADAEGFVTDHASAARVTRDPGVKDYALWAIRLDGALVGVIELRLEALHSATIGFWVGGDRRGNGIMSEALFLVLDFAFGDLGLRRIHWEAVAGNVPSASVARSAGFVYEGLQRRAMVHRDERVDSWHGSLLADDPRTPADGWPL